MSRASVTITSGTAVVSVTRNQVALGQPLLAAHNGLQDRDEADAHPIAAITGLQAALDDLSTHNELTGRDADDAHPISAITGLQTALDAKQTAHANLTALAGLTGAADLLPYFTGVGAMATTALTSFGRGLLAYASASALLTGIGAEATANKGIAGGYASLDGSGKIPSAQLPAIAITDTFVVASQVAMLALTAETGDVAVRSDLNKSFILAGSDPTILGNWQELLTPTDAVLSVNGYTGAVTIGAGDLSTGTLAAARGGTGVSNAGTLTNASNTTITGGGTVALGGFTLTVPATGTAALLAANNAHTGADTFTNTAGIVVRYAATNDGVALIGRNGGSSSYYAAISPPTLTATRTWTGVDANDTFAYLGQAQTFGALQTIDTGSGAHVTTGVLKGTGIQLAAANALALTIASVSYGTSNGLTMQGVLIGGTRASPSATAASGAFFQLLGYGTTNGTAATGAKVGYVMGTPTLWSPTSNATSHIWAGTLDTDTTYTNWMWLQGTKTTDPFGTLGIGAAPTAGNGLLQLASGATKAYGIAWGTDTFLYRTGAAAAALTGSFTASGKLAANSAAASSTLTGNTVAQVITWLQSVFA